MHILDGFQSKYSGVWDADCFAHRHRRTQPVDRHHVWPLGEGGPDVEDNIVRVCPNAHRRIHTYIRLLKKHNGKVPWIKRKFFGYRVRYVGQAGYDAMVRHIEEIMLRHFNYDEDEIE